jgi:hypothetical protein
MKKPFQMLLIAALTLTGCAGSRLSSDEARKKIAELGRSNLVPDAIEIRRISSQTDTEVIAESTITLAFQFKKSSAGEWRVAAVRLGDRDWVDLNELLAAMNEGRSRQTTELMEKVMAGVTEYRNANNALPAATEIVGLTDLLHPKYMRDLVRQDAWGHPIDYEVRGTTFKLTSHGPDGVRGTPDDIVRDGVGTASP